MTKLRCRTCGTDHPYTDRPKLECEVCECVVSTIDMKVILPKAVSNEQGDPLQGM